MGYTFRIGEAALKVPDADVVDEAPALDVHVPETVRFEDAPGIANWRDFSYGGFARVATEAGIGDIMLQGSNGVRAPLVPRHPGAAMLTPATLARFEAGLSMVRVKYGSDAPEV